MKLFPTATMGKWAVRLAAIFLIAYFLALIASYFNISIGRIGVVYGLGIGLAGTSALVLGLVSIFKKEYALLVFLSLFVGLYALLFLAFLVWLTFFGDSLFNLDF